MWSAWRLNSCNKTCSGVKEKNINYLNDKLLHYIYILFSTVININANEYIFSILKKLYNFHSMGSSMDSAEINISPI